MEKPKVGKPILWKNQKLENPPLINTNSITITNIKQSKPYGTNSQQ
ncbi:hypothetical protein [Streptococcus suis]